MGDRGGGREGKKKSLNKIKQTKNKMEKEYMRDKDKTAVDRPQFSVEPPPLLLAAAEESDSSRPLFDCACHLTSRQFDGVVNSALRRAADAGVACIVVDTLDFSKADDVLALVKEQPGLLYASMGVSPDSIKVSLLPLLLHTQLTASHSLLRRAAVVFVVVSLRRIRISCSSSEWSGWLSSLYRLRWSVSHAGWT